MGVVLEFLPGFEELGLAGDELLVAGGEVDWLLLDRFQIIQQVEAHGVLPTGHQCLGYSCSLILGSEPQGCAHAGGKLTVPLHEIAGGQILG